MECKREGCTRPGETRARYEGCCSIECRDYHELETGFLELREKLRIESKRADTWERNHKRVCDENIELRAEVKRLKNERNRYRNLMLRVYMSVPYDVCSDEDEDNPLRHNTMTVGLYRDIRATLTPAETDSDQEVQGEGTGCTCQLCGSKYTVDFNVPDDVWETIREGKNLLCPVCIARKIEDLPGFAAYELQTTKQGEG